jgi:hypothetical protein
MGSRQGDTTGIREPVCKKLLGRSLTDYVGYVCLGATLHC